MQRPVVHHRYVPEPNSCRWCGIGQRDHARRWSRAVGWHEWVEPTPAQRRARMSARRALAVGREHKRSMKS
jgi:hypothetical protein